MTEIQHHITDDILESYRAGRLPHAFAVVVAAHLSLCPACRARAETADFLGGALLNGLEGAALRAGARERMMAALDAAPVQHIGNILVVWRQRREEDKPAAAAEKKPARAATAKSAAAFAAAARRAALAKASAESRRSPARSPAPRGRGTGSSSGSRGR